MLEIDDRLAKLDEEKAILLSERNNIISQQNAELAKYFNQSASPEAKVDLYQLK